jgi:hypothetical protein
MPGFPLAAIGAGLGMWAKNQQEQQAARERQQMLQLTLQRYQQEMQDRQRQRQTEGAMWQSESDGGPRIGPVNPMPASGGVGVPIQQAALGLDAARGQDYSNPSAGVSMAGRGQLGGRGDALSAFAPGNRNEGITAAPQAPGPQAYAGLRGPGAPPESAAGSFDTSNVPFTNRAGQNIGTGTLPPARGGGFGSQVSSVSGGAAAERPTQVADASGAQPAPRPPPATATGQQVAEMMAPDAHLKARKDALVQNIARIPGLDDGQRAELFVKQWAQIRPEEAEYAREFMANQRENRQDARADTRADRTDARIGQREAATAAREEARENRKWGEPVKMEMPDGTSQYVQVNKGTGDVRPVKGLTGDVTKIGSQAAAKPADHGEVSYWTKVLQAGGAFPPGLARTRTGSNLVQEIMKNMAKEGSIPGGMTPGDFIANHSAVRANTNSLSNMTKMSDAAISFEKLAEKNFDVALRLAPDAVPTELGPFFNQWIERGETMIGDPNVPPYVAAMLTGANEYAKVMSGSTGTAASTNESRRQAAEMFSPYFSLPQISQVIAVAKADMKNRENTLTEQTNLIKQRLGSSAPVEIAPAASPKKTGQESQSTPAQPGQPAGEVVQNGWRYDAKTHQPLGPVQ